MVSGSAVWIQNVSNADNAKLKLYSVLGQTFKTYTKIVNICDKGPPEMLIIYLKSMTRYILAA